MVFGQNTGYRRPCRSFGEGIGGYHQWVPTGLELCSQTRPMRTYFNVVLLHTYSFVVLGLYLPQKRHRRFQLRLTKHVHHRHPCGLY